MKFIPGLVCCLIACLQVHATVSLALTGPVQTERLSASGASWEFWQHRDERLSALDLGLVINTADPYSVAVGNYYASRRGIPAGQVLRLDLPTRSSLSVAEFNALDARIRQHMGPQVQALALAWTTPFAVACNSLTAALTLGMQANLCRATCAPSEPSPYFNSSTTRPFTDLNLRPSMLLAARSVAAAKAMIDRGIAADGQLGLLGSPPVNAIFVSTADKARNVRSGEFPSAGPIKGFAAQVVRLDSTDTAPVGQVFLYQTGLAQPIRIDTIDWAAGALADHLTSFGGQLLGAQGQMSVLDWLQEGATASYGTVSEPCNHLQKFPHPQVLLDSYLRGSTAIEAYWRSVAWPAQGIFVGEPLAAPFARRHP